MPDRTAIAGMGTRRQTFGVKSRCKVNPLDMMLMCESRTIHGN
jgi:hypothetical protein